jgi:uncharacterized membrane protein
MEQTKDRNGVLLYIAMESKQLAIYGDEGIHKIVGQDYWNEYHHASHRKFQKR